MWNIYKKKHLKFSTNANPRKSKTKCLIFSPKPKDRKDVPPLSNCSHPNTMLSKRFLKFMRSMVTSNKPCVSYLARLVQHDNRTLAGRTLSKLSRDCNGDRDSLTVSLVSKDVKYFPVPDDHLWRVQILKELLNVDRSFLVISNFSSIETSHMINFLCTSWRLAWWWRLFFFSTLQNILVAVPFIA